MSCRVIFLLRFLHLLEKILPLSIKIFNVFTSFFVIIDSYDIDDIICFKRPGSPPLEVTK